jgi:hypothetical protein
MPNGRSFEQIGAPPGFNIATASNALLTELNFPPRPAGVARERSWQAQVAPFSKIGISGAEAFCEMPPFERGTPASGHRVGVVPAGSVGHTALTFWSGYELQSGPYQKAVGHFVQPAVTGTSGASMINWIGLNGTGSGSALIQAGTYNNTGSSVGALFWELFCSGASDCNGPMSVAGVNASAGQTVSVSVAFDPLDNQAIFQVARNGSLLINMPYPLDPGTNSGRVADFITERITPGALENFVTVPFSASRTYVLYNSSNSEDFGVQSYYSYEMTRDGAFHTVSCSAGSLILAYPNDVSSGGFVNNFCKPA